jgi:tetratricopeptide (TPR) repeat protein
MLDQVAAAIDRQDFQTARRLLQELIQQSPQNPWVHFYRGRLQEATSKLEEAQKIYRQLLRETTNPKLAVQARQGLQRVESLLQERQQQAIDEAQYSTITPTPPGADRHDLGFLVLEGIAGDGRTEIIQNFARVMKLDAYTARMLLPAQGWRLYRAGLASEIEEQGQQLRKVGVPVNWIGLAQLQAIQVFRVNFFESVSPRATVVCRNSQNQTGILSFEWSEVSQRVEGMLPVFEQVVTLGYRDRLERKEETQDYIHCCDLHLPRRRCILRLQDNRYLFNQGISVIPKQAMVGLHDRNTNRTHWNSLMDLLHRQLPEVPTWSNFTPFAESAADFAIPLRRVEPYVDVPRLTDYYWDPAFQLYSGTLFLRQNKQGQ